MNSLTHLVCQSAVLLLGLTACGGGADSTPGNPTTPIPPTVGAPASLAVSGGDGQSTFAGAALALTPTVTVRDAAGQPVAGAAINFEVVSGGGSIAGSVATSNAQGIATAGPWTLGTSGEQIVEARLGSLTPARFRATISTGIVDATIPASGGVIEISTPAHPWRGLKLTIPAGAFAEPGTWRFELAPSASMPTLPAGFTVSGPALRIETDKGRAERLMTLRIPAPRVAGSVRLFVLVDPARSVMEMAPIVAEDSESISVVVGHLNASMLLSRSGANSSVLSPTQMSTRQLNFGLGINVNATLNALGLTEALAGYLANAWPGPDVGSYGFPAGHGPAMALMNLFGQLQNQPFSGLVALLPAFGVLADTASFASLQIMADRHRRSPTAQRAIDDLSAALASVTIPLRDSLSTISLWGGLSISKLPQLMVFEERFAPTTGRRVFASMYGKGNGALLFSSPTAPTTQSTLTLGAGGFFSRIVKENADATSFNAQGVLPVGGSFIYPVAEFVDVVPTMMAALRAQGAVRDQANRQLAAAAGFPNVTLEVQNAATGDWSPAETTIVIRDSSAVLRVQCGNCPQALPQNGSSTQQTVAVENRSPSGYAGTLFSLGPQSTGTLLNALGVGDLNGAAMTRMDPSVTLSSVSAAYRAAVPIHRPLALALFRLAPDSQRVVIDSLVLLRATLDLPPPRGYYIDWDFGDGSAIVRTTNVAEVSHRYTEEGTRQVVAVLRNGLTSAAPGLRLAKATGTVLVKVCADDFTDARDGVRYKLVCIGTQTWMAENLRFATGDSRCYNDNPANCVIYGRMYSWTTALNGTAPSTTNPSYVRGVCASGWHMPSMAEWFQLRNRFGTATTAGAALKSTTLWNQPDNGTNSSGFGIAPAGIYNPPPSNPAFIGLGQDAFLWGTDEFVVGPGFLLGSIVRVLRNSSVFFDNGQISVQMASVRCLRN